MPITPAFAHAFLIARAACGDVQSLARLCACGHQNLWQRVATLLLMDSAPHPLASLIAFVTMNPPPAALRERIVPLEALHALLQPACKTLLMHVRSRCFVTESIVDALVTPDVLQDERACAALLSLNEQFAEPMIAGVTAISASHARQASRAMVIAVIARSPYAAAYASACWSDLTPDERIILARAASDSPNAAAALLERIGANGWARAPQQARAALCAAIVRDPRAAARSGAVWTSMDKREKELVALAAAKDAFCAAKLIETIGADGWRDMPVTAKAKALESVHMVPHAAVIACQSIWTTLSDDARVRIAQIAAENPLLAADLLARIGGSGLTSAPADARDLTLNAVMTSPWTAACGGSAAWDALDDNMRIMLANAASANPEAAAFLAERIGAERWRSAPIAARQALLNAIARNPQRAAHAVAAWNGMNDIERQTLVALAARRSMRAATLAASLMEHLGGGEQTALPPAMRRTLMRAVCRSPLQARFVAESLWDWMTDAERAAIAHGIARDPSELDAWLDTTGARAWMALPDQDRMDALARMRHDPYAAVQVGGAIWSVLRAEDRGMVAQSAARDASAAVSLIQRIGEEGWDATPPPARAMLMHAVARSPDAAAQAFIVLRRRLDAAAQSALVRATLEGVAALPAIAQSLLRKEPMRNWMALSYPGEEDDANTLDACRHALEQCSPEAVALVLARLPASVAARLASLRKRRRR